MAVYEKPARWADPASRLFPHQVGFTAPPHEFDAAPTDFLRMAPEGVGVHGRMLHVPGYAHELAQRADNFNMNDGRERIPLADLARIVNTGIRKSRPGVYVDACTRGVGSGCRSDQIVEVELDTEAAVLFKYESAARLLYRRDGRFRTLWLSGRPDCLGRTAVQAMEHEGGRRCAFRLHTA